MSEDDTDGGIDAAEGLDFAEETYQDFVAERAAAFGFLALKLESVKDEKAKELGLTMLKAIVRSIRTPADATLSEVPKA